MSFFANNLSSRFSWTQTGVLAVALFSQAIVVGLAQERAGVVMVVKGHGTAQFDGHVTSVSFSHDGRRAVSADMFGIVKLWEVPSLKEIRTLHATTGPGVKNWAHSVKFSPDDRYIVCGSGDKSVWIWDVESGTVRRRVKGHTEAVRHVFFLPDGKRALSIDKNGTSLIWNLEGDVEPEHVDMAARPDPSVLCSHDADISNDQRKLAFASGEHTVLYDLQRDRELLRVKDRCSAVALSPDGRHMAIARDRVTPKPIELCDTTTGKILWESPIHFRSALAFTADGKRLLTCNAGDAHLWDVDTGDEVGRFPVSEGSNLVCVACASDKPLVLFGTSSGRVILFRFP